MYRVDMLQVRLWDNRSSSSEPMSEVIVGGKVTSLDLSRDLNTLAVCSRDDKIQVISKKLIGGPGGMRKLFLVRFWT